MFCALNAHVLKMRLSSPAVGSTVSCGKAMRRICRIAFALYAKTCAEISFLMMRPVTQLSKIESVSLGVAG